MKFDTSEHYQMNTTTNYKSPFLIYREFSSPLLCENIIESLNLTVPDTDTEGKPIPFIKQDDYMEAIIFERFDVLRPQIIKYYGIEARGTERMTFEWYPTGAESALICDNSVYVREKWLRTRDRDLTAVLFLCNYQETTPFSDDFEVCGGKLEFPQWGFGFNPERGTLIVYPSDPHFINKTALIQAGELYQVRFHIAATTPYLFNPDNFPGNYQIWFKDLLE